MHNPRTRTGPSLRARDAGALAAALAVAVAPGCSEFRLGFGSYPTAVPDATRPAAPTPAEERREAPEPGGGGNTLFSTPWWRILRDVPEEEGFRMIRGVVVHRGTRPDTCGPSALAAVLGFWKDPVTVEQMESAVLRFDAHGMDTRDFLAVANRRGFVGQYERGSVGRIKEAIDAGLPPIVAVPGHAMVAVGYNERTQEVVFAEPVEGFRAIPFDALVPTWYGAGFLFIVLRPGAAAELVALGDAARDRGQFREADALYARAIEREPGAAAAHVGRGDLYYYWQRYPEAEASYREALRLDPSNCQALNNLAFFLIDQKREAREADALAERGISFAAAEWRRLWADYESVPTPALRADLCGRLHRVMVMHLSALSTRGRVRKALGDAAGALDLWRTGLQLAPDGQREYRANRFYDIATTLAGTAPDEARRMLDAAEAVTASAQLKRRIVAARAGLDGVPAKPPGS
jgi:tetratricopeptide (TPR) repeat protein